MAKTPAAEKSKDAPVRASAEITYRPREGDPATTVWNKLTFEANKPRTVSNPDVIKAARGNPWFEVDGEKAPEKKAGPPKTSEEYRAHAVAWIKDADTVKAMVERWDQEETLRRDCEVGGDDLGYIAQFYDPKLEALKQAEAEASAQ